jgi:DNA-directed RNA polymerase specialized sigma24 family protein
MVVEKKRTYKLDFNQYLSNDYSELVNAVNKITGNNELAIDLLHYCIEEVSYKHNLQDIIDSGGMRFYIVRIAMTQWRSSTGPFYKAFVKRGGQVELDKVEHLIEKETEGLDIKRVNQIVDSLPWYDKELWKLYVEGGYNYTGLAKVTGIPRTSIGLTINRVKKHIKKHI